MGCSDPIKCSRADSRLLRGVFVSTGRHHTVRPLLGWSPSPKRKHPQTFRWQCDDVTSPEKRTLAEAGSVTAGLLGSPPQPTFWDLSGGGKALKQPVSALEQSLGRKGVSPAFAPRQVVDCFKECSVRISLRGWVVGGAKSSSSVSTSVSINPAGWRRLERRL